MHVLQISNAFLGTKVHRNLTLAFDKMGIRQTVFAVIRKYKKPNTGNLVDFETVGSSVLFSRTLKHYHRLLFHLKSGQLFRDLVSQVDPESVDVVHATTLFTDGILAYKFLRKYGTPYLITIRSADVDHFFKYRPDLISMAYRILDNASRIIFVSPSLKDRFFTHRYIKKHKERWKKKIELQRNGVEDFWLDRTFLGQREVSIPTKLLYVGRFVKRKNLLRLAEALNTVRKNHPRLSLTIIGSHGKDEYAIKSQLRKFADFISFLPSTTDKQELLENYRAHDLFVMPSYYETFGLVYIEAMTQGLPVLYSRNDGIDGIFAERQVGEAVDPFNVASIADGLQKLIVNYQSYRLDEIAFASFRWSQIAEKYDNIYASIRRNLDNKK